MALMEIIGLTALLLGSKGGGVQMSIWISVACQNINKTPTLPYY